MSTTINRRMFLQGTAAIGALAYASRYSSAFAATDEFAGLDAMAQADLVRSGAVKPFELVEAAIARAERLNPQLNAIVHTAYDAAREAALSADLPEGPFKGVPYLIKDLSAWKGQPLTYGSQLYAKQTARKDDGDVARAKAAGVIIIGKSNTPEFGLLPTTESTLLGAAHNPWSLDHHTGGSSGGAAAAVAAGIVPIANAGDGGGSIRIPSSACGLVGLKASRGRLFTRPKNKSPVDLTVRMGLSRTVRDTAQLLNIAELKGDDALFEPVGFVSGPSSKRLKIAFSTETGAGPDADPEVKAALERVAKLCADLGHEVIEASPPFDAGEMEEHFMSLWSGLTRKAVRRSRFFGLSRFRFYDSDEVFEPWTVGLVEFFNQREKKNPGQLKRAVEYFNLIEAQYEDYFQSYDVALTPVLRKPPLRIGELGAGLSFDEMYARTIDYAAYTAPHNGAGTSAISLPLSFSSDGLPIGSQFAARQGGEATLLALAYELEEANDWADQWPPHSAVRL